MYHLIRKFPVWFEIRLNDQLSSETEVICCTVLRWLKVNNGQKVM